MRQPLEDEVKDLTHLITERELAVFGPPGERHLIPVEWVPIAASFVLGAFFKGFAEGAEENLKNLGKNTGKWLVDRMTELFEKGSSAFGDWMHTLELSKQRARAAASPDVEKIADEVQTLISKTLTERGLLASSAARIAEKARSAAIRQMTP